MQQPELTAAAAQGKGADLFASARQEQPHCYFILLDDRRPGHEGERHMLAIDNASCWGRLLEHDQVVDIYVPDGRAS